MHLGAGAPDSLRPLELGKTVCKQGGTYNKSLKLNSAGGVLNTRLPSSPLTHVKVNRNRKTHFIILIHYTILKFLFQYINKILQTLHFYPKFSKFTKCFSIPELGPDTSEVFSSHIWPLQY